MSDANQLPELTQGFVPETPEKLGPLFFTVEELGVIDRALQDAPFKEVAPVFNTINLQLRALQQTPVQPTYVAEDKAPAPNLAATNGNGRSHKQRR